MTMPWNKHSSTWDVPWADRWEQRDVTINKQWLMNPKFNNYLGGAAICIGFWVAVAFVIF